MAQNSPEAGSADRTGWSFGQLLAWHFLRGTRPGGKVDQPGRTWSAKSFADAVGVGDRTIRYWLRDEHLPPEIETIERLLFGNDACYDDWRLELRQAHARSAGVKGGAASASPTEAERDVRPARTGPASNIPIRVPPHFMGRDARRDRGGTRALSGQGRRHRAARVARRGQDHARRRLCRAPSRRISRDLVDQGADRAVDARRHGRARGAARLGRRRRQGGAGARGGDGAVGRRGRGHAAHLRQRDLGRCPQAVFAARGRGARARHLELVCLARRCRAGRDTPLAQADRRGLPDRPDRA
jgi:hypothetical protein